MTIQSDYQITLPEYIDGGQAINKARLANPWMLWGVSRGVPILGLLTAFFSFWIGIFALNHPSGTGIDNQLLVWMQFDRLSGNDAATYIALGCISLVASIVNSVCLHPSVFMRGQRKSCERTWQKNPLMGERRTLTATEIELSLNSKSLQITWEWAALNRVIESQMVFIVYWFTGESKMISKQCFASEDELDRFRDLVRHRVKNYIDLTQDSVRSV
ncbi:YcxB family protein [Altericista sp. CCNU0014]|uniref:YcxB family protein n=1 Tax=Altericista sp. CCNU0014 TaxID=3082949 RepID=UPI00384D18E2